MWDGAGKCSQEKETWILSKQGASGEPQVPLPSGLCSEALTIPTQSGLLCVSPANTVLTTHSSFQDIGRRDVTDSLHVLSSH